MSQDYKNANQEEIIAAPIPQPIVNLYGAAEAVKFVGYLMQHKQIMQKLYNDLENMHIEFDVHDASEERLFKERTKQGDTLQRCLEAAYDTEEPQIINMTLSIYLEYVKATPNYAENALDFIRVRREKLESS
jgi:hypothetical protein